MRERAREYYTHEEKWTEPLRSPYLCGTPTMHADIRPATDFISSVGDAVLRATAFLYTSFSPFCDRTDFFGLKWPFICHLVQKSVSGSNVFLQHWRKSKGITKILTPPARVAPNCHTPNSVALAEPIFTC